MRYFCKKKHVKTFSFKLGYQAIYAFRRDIERWISKQVKSARNINSFRKIANIIFYTSAHENT